MAFLQILSYEMLLNSFSALSWCPCYVFSADLAGRCVLLDLLGGSQGTPPREGFEPASKAQRAVIVAEARASSPSSEVVAKISWYGPLVKEALVPSAFPADACSGRAAESTACSLASCVVRVWGSCAAVVVSPFKQCG